MQDPLIQYPFTLGKCSSPSPSLLNSLWLNHLIFLLNLFPFRNSNTFPHTTTPSIPLNTLLRFATNFFPHIFSLPCQFSSSHTFPFLAVSHISSHLHTPLASSHIFHTAHILPQPASPSHTLHHAPCHPPPNALPPLTLHPSLSAVRKSSGSARHMEIGWSGVQWCAVVCSGMQW